MGPEMTGEPTSTLDVLQREAAEKTGAAVAEGQKDVHEVEETSASYLEQAKSMAESVLASAQEFLRGSTEGQEKASAGQQSSPSKGTLTHGQPRDVLGSLKTTAESGVGTAQEYLASAQAAVQPRVESTRATLEPHVAGAKAALQLHVEKAQETAQSYLGVGVSKPEVVTPPTSGTAASGETLGPSSKTGPDDPKLESEVA
ncbi:hypothetical protein F5I97DRAFT_1214068 [Phlebopus sp. FC_14]|nr:hypothetical protein F5I97DRAFT_1214068 [Phlebopus sp. FC_14]